MNEETFTKLKDYVFDVVYQYFDTHDKMSKEHFFDIWATADGIFKEDET